MNGKIEIERKYVILKPDIRLLEGERGFSKSEIVQIYLESDEKVTHRIRKRKNGIKTVYTETKKLRIDGISAFEDERIISEDDYNRLKNSIKAGTSPIEKNRYTFSSGDKVVEIDIYPNWEKTAIMEIELNSREENVEIPFFITVIEEVTGNKAYSNAQMSKEFPKEII